MFGLGYAREVGGKYAGWRSGEGLNIIKVVVPISI